MNESGENASKPPSFERGVQITHERQSLIKIPLHSRQLRCRCVWKGRQLQRSVALEIAIFGNARRQRSTKIISQSFEKRSIMSDGQTTLQQLTSNECTTDERPREYTSFVVRWLSFLRKMNLSTEAIDTYRAGRERSIPRSKLVLPQRSPKNGRCRKQYRRQTATQNNIDN